MHLVQNHTQQSRQTTNVPRHATSATENHTPYSNYFTRASHRVPDPGAGNDPGKRTDDLPSRRDCQTRPQPRAAPRFSLPPTPLAGGGSKVGLIIWRGPYPHPEENMLAVPPPPLLPPPLLVPPWPPPLPRLPRHATIDREEPSVPALPTFDVEPLRVPSEPLCWPPKALRLPPVPQVVGLAMLLDAEL